MNPLPTNQVDSVAAGEGAYESDDEVPPARTSIFY